MAQKSGIFLQIKELLFGPARDPFSQETRQHIALMAFFAWVGLGADGLSSSAYGPEEAFKALGTHTHLSLYLALATAFTVFLISTAYNQVIELFPTGGGGYKVATQLIGTYAGLISGAALIVDYVLTIAISVASGVDAVFSSLPNAWQTHKLTTELILTLLLIGLNLRGMKESIKILTPIFMGFVLTHILIIVYGVAARGSEIPTIVSQTLTETKNLAGQMGWVFVASLFLRAYSLGGGTYTGIEAVSNNINVLKEPRVHTGKLTMFYMALSLAFTAGGIILLYLLWQAVPSANGETLNAVAFRSVIASLGLSPTLSYALLTLLLVLEGALLYVAANTGLLGGPAVLANMANDGWAPTQFSSLSTRLVTKYGILMMGFAAILILLWSGGVVDLLAVLYSINVFLTFSLSLLGLTLYWWKHREHPQWGMRLALSFTGLVVAGSILIVTLVEKFFEGGWMTVMITSGVIALCLLIRQHYRETGAQMARADQLLANIPVTSVANPPALDPESPTAVFLISRSKGSGMHTILWVQRLFPNIYRNFIFLSVGAVDTQSFGGEGSMEGLKESVHSACDYYVNFCHQNGIAAKAYEAFGTDRVAELTKLAEQVHDAFPNCIFFASKLIFVHDNWLTRILHNQTALQMQRILHLQGMTMVILPMKVD
ncbi:MAG: amino acid permease [Ferrovum sp.]|nr:amino acid permease [Ferrovum sp.]NDU87128.1 amino acid permease [Ferrovum sp.]